MSILNYCCGEDRAIVVVDTLCIGRSGACSEASKLTTILHAGLVFAARGNPLFFHLMLPLLQRERDYESANERMREALPVAFDEFKRQSPGRDSDGQEVVICGYHHEARAYEGTFYRIKRDRIQSGRGRHIALPWEESWGMPGLAPRLTPELMKELMLEQVRRAREAKLGEALGGRMLAAELSRGRILLTEQELV